MIERLRADRPEDRLATAVFVAALLHGLLILGVRFSGPAADDGSLPTLEVLLVPEGPAEAPNPGAAYIAERSQHGSGTGVDTQRTSLPEAMDAGQEGAQPDDGFAAPQDPAEAADGRSPILTSRQLAARRTVAGEAATEVAPAAASPGAPLAIPPVSLNAAAAEERLHLRGKPSADGQLRADTRESAIARYLDGWKRRIERVGTLNFPNEARRREMSGNPVIEVVIHADGTLAAVIVRRSSGHRELDDAAVAIVRLAAPFDPFPAAMRERYPVLRFAYEWQFLNGRLGSGAVFSGAP